MSKTLRVCLAALKQRPSVSEGVEKLVSVLRECRERKVDIACTPETYLPGLRGATFDLPDPDQPAMERALKDLRAACRETGVAIIAGMEWRSELGLENRAFVISPAGRVLGYQTKNQITPGGESENYVPDGRRRVFNVKGVTFGITICHEGWRYPETVRWPALRGAQVVFQPQVTGSDEGGRNPMKWGRVLLREGHAVSRWGEQYLLCQRQPGNERSELSHQPDRPAGRSHPIRPVR